MYKQFEIIDNILDTSKSKRKYKFPAFKLPLTALSFHYYTHTIDVALVCSIVQLRKLFTVSELHNKFHGLSNYNP